MNKKKIFILLMIFIILILLFAIIFVGNIKSRELKAENLDINSELVEKLYNYILHYNSYTEETVYQNKLINVNELDNFVKILTVFENIDIEKDCYKKEYDERFYPDEYCEHYFTKEFIDSKAKEIFGDSVTVNPIKETYLVSAKLNFENGEYIYTKLMGGSGGTIWFPEYKLIKAEKIGDNIYLYDKYLHIVKKFNDNVKCYNASDREVLLFEKEPILSDMDIIDEVKIDDVKNASNFKHTFAKKSDGSYYWVSTEMVK